MKTRQVYLLHFSEPYKHAKHYLGSAVNAVERLKHHKSESCDVRLLRVVKAAGITFEIARIWKGDRRLERRLKGRGLSRLCPICKQKGSNGQTDVLPSERR